MRYQLILAAAAAFSVSVAALPHLNAPHVIHEKREVLHPKWVKRSAVVEGRTLPVRIGMTQSNLDQAHSLLMDVADPSSPRYGQHYTADEVTELFKPAQRTVDQITEWLKDAGVSHFSHSVNKQWIQLDLKVEELESLLRTKYHEYEHTTSGNLHVACDE
jgi:tripeptidyl-peptidase-1